MTTQTEAAAGTELVAQVAPGALALASGEKSWTVLQLAEQLAVREPVLPADEPPPAAPKATPELATLRKAFKRLAEVFGKVEPADNRILSPEELADLTEEANAIAAVLTQLGERQQSISALVRNHGDHYGESLGLITGETIRIASGVAKGHWLFARPQNPFSIPVPGWVKAWQQVYVKGKLTVNGAQVGALKTAGKITHDEYLKVTEAKRGRAYSELRMADFIRKNPVRGLEILGMITSREAPSASLTKPDK